MSGDKQAGDIGHNLVEFLQEEEIKKLRMVVIRTEYCLYINCSFAKPLQFGSMFPVTHPYVIIVPHHFYPLIL